MDYKAINFTSRMDLSHILYNKKDFERWCDGLDSLGMNGKKYLHDHNGEPESYPCMVYSRFYDPNGPYSYDHEVIYPKDIFNLALTITETPEVTDGIMKL